MALQGSFVSAETKEMLQPQDVRSFGDANKVRKNISWQGQTSCEITSSAQDPLTCRIVPPGVDGKRNANAADAKDFQKYCTEGAMVVLGSVLLGMVLCCVVRLWRKGRRSLSSHQSSLSPSSGLSSSTSHAEELKGALSQGRRTASPLSCGVIGLRLRHCVVLDSNRELLRPPVVLSYICTPVLRTQLCSSPQEPFQLLQPQPLAAPLWLSAWQAV
ncbi:uncharacterized protein LOC126037056 isoform X1 [Accipiter gentilis]|uniref:uncharacterized protein LOC126037056 isoform X1 n=1 Tax=Astur gentilis TaxID=8957 RepID=UPI002110DC1C|nr:uncharacterized protein LOC126037056 isoform X1 [Accipiter gentilis]XP_049653242.1 uncharacterized protein LOC126037056 isoform X1 [Accipiter gentilis]